MTKTQLAEIRKAKDEDGLSWSEIRVKFNKKWKQDSSVSWYTNYYYGRTEITTPKAAPRVLLVDIETAPILASVWGLWDQTVPLNMIKKDWHILSWSAKWLGSPKTEIFYEDQRKAKNIEDDKKILLPLWKLLDEADVMLSHNGIAFDHKKINARFVLNGMKPPSTYRHIDTLQIAKRHFAFTSNKLEYLSGKLGENHKKLTARKFSGFDLWRACLEGNQEAWAEMEKYNKTDVLALEELYRKLAPWDKSINFGVFTGAEGVSCSCGSTNIIASGYSYTNTGKFARFTCTDCGKEQTGRKNLLSKDKKSSLLK